MALIAIADRGGTAAAQRRFQLPAVEQRKTGGQSAGDPIHRRAHLRQEEELAADQRRQGREPAGRSLPAHHHRQHRRRDTWLRLFRVRGKIEKNKRNYPWAQFIVDSVGLGRIVWRLPEESSTIVVLDQAGRVQWAKDGALTPQEVDQVIALLRTLIDRETP